MAKSKLVSLEQALGCITEGMTIMVAGFLGVGTPELLIDGIINQNIKNLTVIVNDTAFPDVGVGKLIGAKLVDRVITSHIGTNPETRHQYDEGTLKIEFNPQGTLVERIRAGGAGLGGILTRAGLNTLIENGKRRIEVGGRSYLLEEPLRADIAILLAHLADTNGNLVYRKAARNFNPVMALAADTVIAQAENVVEAGEIDPDRVMTPGILVDYVVRGGQENG